MAPVCVRCRHREHERDQRCSILVHTKACTCTESLYVGDTVTHRRLAARATIVPYMGIGEGGSLAGVFVQWLEPAGMWDTGDCVEVSVELLVRVTENVLINYTPEDPNTEDPSTT